MIIEAKGSKTEQSAPQGRDRFAFGIGDRLSKVPFYIAMGVIAIAVYLRSIAQGRAATASDEPMPDGQPEPVAPVNWCLPGEMELNTAEAEGLVDETITGSIGEEPGPRNQIGAGLPWPGQFALPEFPSLIFMAPPEFVLPPIAAFFPVVVSVAGMNDNLPGVGPGATGDGDGNGHGGSDSDDDDDDDDGDDDGDNGSGPGEDDDETLNRAPVVTGPVRLNDVFAGQILLIGLSQLLVGASDPDGDDLSILNISMSGTGTGNALSWTSGGWELATANGSLGPVTITYWVSDGQAWVVQTAHFDIVRNSLTLTPYDDVFVGTPYDDDIDGLAGDDIIDGRAGNDQVVGGDGDDHIFGGDGDDDLFGNAGNDVISGGNGDDMISGGQGDDRLFGDAGDDTIFGDGGDDHIYGGAGDDNADGGQGDDHVAGEDGNDILRGGEGCDVIKGGVGADVLLGEAGADRLEGGAGGDVLEGGSGNDIMLGGSGDDTMIGDAGCDEIDGGEGHDLLDYSAATADVVIDLVGRTSYSAQFDEDTFESIEEVATGSGDDLFIIGATATIVSGGRGRDTFVFEVTDATPMLSEDVMHHILDFVVGDRIRVRDYEIDREARELEADLFRQIYDDDDDDWLMSDLPIIVQHVRYDDVDNTIIMADLNRDNVYETTINIRGVLLNIDPDANLA